jgi:hypothetical protein
VGKHLNSILLILPCLAAQTVVDEERPAETPDGVRTAFTLAQVPVAVSIKLYRNGVRLTQGGDYHVSGAQLVFEACCIPQMADILRVDYRAAPPPPSPVLISIDSGGPGDQFFSPVSTCTTGGTCAYAAVNMGPPPLGTARYGFSMIPFVYRIPVPVGTCDLALDFVEPNKTAAGQRVFTVQGNDQSVADVDIFARVGLLQPLTVTIPAIATPAGQLLITFTPKPGTWNAIVNAIRATCHPSQ